MNDRLLIIKIYKKILDEVYQSMINIPKVHYCLKEVIVREMFSYLQDLYIANDISNREERKLKKENMVIRLKYISSLIGILNKFKILGERKYISINSDMELLLRLMKGWINI